MKGLEATGQPNPDPAREPAVDGSLVNIPGGGTNWPSPSFSPQTGLFHVNAKEGYSVNYLTDDDPEPQGTVVEAEAVFPAPSCWCWIIRPVMWSGSTNTLAGTSAKPFRAYSPRPGGCCSPGILPEICWPTIRRTVTFGGTSARYPWSVTVLPLIC